MTTIYKANEIKELTVQKHITSVIENGGLIIFPTETVYGIGANALDSSASSKIYQAKGRPSDNPLIVHINTKEAVDLYAYKPYPYIDKLIEVFFPGPLTLVLPKKDIVPKTTTGGLDTVAIRMPSNIIALEIIRLAKVPIAAPSANLSGKPSSTQFKHVKDDFMSKVDIMIDGGDSEIGLESTVLDCTLENPQILRPGFITKEMLEAILLKDIEDHSNIEAIKDVKSPGMKYTHYKPKGTVTLLNGSLKAIETYLLDQLNEKKNVAYLCSSEKAIYNPNLFTIDLGSIMDLNQIAHNVFKALRQMDDEKMDFIFIESIPQKALGAAIMNRLLKASGYKQISL